MQCRREIVTALRAKYDLDRRVADFKCKHGFVEKALAPDQLICDDDLLPNPQFCLPSPSRIRRLFLQTLYESDGFPIIDFLLDILKRQIDVDNAFIRIVRSFVADSVQAMESRLSEKRFLFEDEEEYFVGYFRRRPNEKEAIKNLTVRFNELSLLLILIAPKMQLDQENPFQSNEFDFEQINDLLENLSLEYAISGRLPSEDLVDYFKLYHYDYLLIVSHSLLKDHKLLMETFADSLGFEVPHELAQSSSPTKMSLKCNEDDASLGALQVSSMIDSHGHCCFRFPKSPFATALIISQKSK